MSKPWISKKNGRYVVGWYEAGKRKSKTFTLKATAELYKADIQIKLNAGLTASLVTVRWDYLKEQYEEAKRTAKCKETSIVEVLLTLSHFERLIGKPNSTQISQAVLDNFKKHRGNENISDWTLNKDIANLKAFLRYFSEDRNHIRPGLKIEKVKAVIKPVRALDEDQIASLLQFLKRTSPTYYIRALLALSAGIDSSTIDRIEISEIHFDRDTIDTFRTKSGKWRMDRPLQKIVMHELANFLDTVPAGQVKLLADTYRRKKWLALTKGAGVKTTFHNLRKTFGSLLQQKGVGLAVAQELLDHSSPETTRRWYTDVSPAHEKAVNTLDVNGWLNS